MGIMLLQNVFSDSDYVISLAEHMGFEPAPVISQCVTDASGNILPMKDLLEVNHPDPSFFNADKVFIHRGSSEFDEIITVCDNILTTVFSEYDVELVTDDWPGTYKLDYVSVVRYNCGGFFHNHSDLLVQPGGNFRSFTIIAYMSDFAGGDLVFADHDIKLSPQKGDVVVFPCGEQYRHESTVVTEGVKYALTLWPLVNTELKLKVGTN